MLESYITPLLMGYVNKYIKNLKPSDLSLSVWGGDVVLQNLELNLDVLQKELNLPVKFLSGRIHELRIHVPWTRITYEPVTVTINTIEFVVKLRDPDEKSSEGDSEADDRAKTKQFKKEMQKAKVAREAEHLPPGYVQGVMNKVVNNISVCVNNLILKYVEEDIVFSLNIKSVSLFSANEDWETAFVELALPSLCLRKICNISDLTICLDSRNADGKIEMYQDPVLYKCNLSCRILSKYQGIGSLSPYENQVNVYCESLDLSSTDVQLPMIIRLLKLCLGLYYRTLDLPGCSYKHHPAEEILEERKNRKTVSKVPQADIEEQSGNTDETGWASWAWSMLPIVTDEATGDDGHSSYDTDTVLLLGIFVTQCSLTLKVTDEAFDCSIVGTKRFEFSPILNIEMSGCAVEIWSKGEEYFDCQFGVCNIVGYMIGDCLCKKGRRDVYNVRSDISMDLDELEKEVEDELFFRIGNPKDTDESGVGFLEDSLFRQPNGNDKTDGAKNSYGKTELPEKGKQFIEAKVVKKFGAFFFDYFYTMELPKEIPADSDHETKRENQKENELVKEVSTKRIIIGACQYFVTSKLYHLMIRIKDFCDDDTPPRKMKDGVFLDAFVTEQLKLGNLPTRGLHVTCNSVDVTFSFADHAFARNEDAAMEKKKEQNSLHGLKMQIFRVDYQTNAPMYPVELNSLLEDDVKPKAMFQRAAFSDYYFKVFGIQFGVCQYGIEFTEPTVLNVMPATHGSVYLKKCISKSTIAECGELELRLTCPNVSFSITKAQTSLLIGLSKSWTSKIPAAVNEAVIDDIFRPRADKDGALSVLEISLIGLELKYAKTDLVHAVVASLGSFKLSIQSLRKGTPINTALMYGPLNTSNMSDAKVFFAEKDDALSDLPNEVLLMFKAQFPDVEAISTQAPTVAVLSLKGIAVNLDPLLLQWIEHKPSTLPRKRKPLFERKPSRLLSRSVSASTPKKKSYSRVIGKTHSKSSKELNQTGKQKEEKIRDPREKKAEDWRLSYAMAVLKSVMLKVDLQTMAIFVPIESINLESEAASPDFNIPFAIKTALKNTSNNFPDTLVITLPHIKIESSNVKDFDVSSDIPFKKVDTCSGDTSLPWALTGSDFSVYTLTSETEHTNLNTEMSYIWYPAQWTMFLAASHADPKTPDNPKSPFPQLQDSLTLFGAMPVLKRPTFDSSATTKEYQPSLGFCVHIDLTSVVIGVSRKQVQIIVKLLSRLSKTLNTLTGYTKREGVSKVLKDETSQAEMKSDIKSPISREIDHRSVSSTSNTDQQDVISVSTTEFSVPIDQANFVKNDNLIVSLWLQWIIPKMSLTFYSEPSVHSTCPIYKIPVELEDLSFAFDYQRGDIRMTSKIGSIKAKNYCLREQSQEWETDKFGGILLSCEDILTNKIEALSSKQNSTSGSFLTLTYTRQPLSEVHSRSRYSSIRSEAVLPAMEQDVDEIAPTSERPVKHAIIEEGVFLQKVNISMQSFDIMLASRPLLEVIESFMGLEIVNSTPDTNAPLVKGRSTLELSPGKPVEAIFQPLPVLELESKGLRILVPHQEAQASRTDNHERFENVAIYRLQSIVIKSQPDNRIMSTVLNKDWYRYLRKHQRDQSRRTKTWHVQYQIDLNGMSFWSGHWDGLNASCKKRDEELALIADGQNPALEWNYELPTRKDPCKLTPILNDFNCRSVISPAITIMLKESMTKVDISATSIEVNFPKEIIAYGNPHQVNLLTDIAKEVTLSLQNLGSKDTEKNISSAGQTLKSPDAVDSGVSSALSLRGALSSLKDPVQPKLQQAKAKGGNLEMFLSAKKLSASLYVIEKEAEFDCYNDSDVYRPVFYLEVIQPTVNAFSVGLEKSFEVVLYDVLLSLGREDRRSNSLPDAILYEDSVFKTTKGRRNDKTGLFASALSLKLIGEESFNVNIDVGRPVNLNLSLGTFSKLDLFTTQLQNETPENVVAMQQQNEDSTRPKALPIDDIEIHTNRVVAKFSSSNDSSTNSLVASIRSLEALVQLRHDRPRETLEASSFSCEVDGLQICISEDERTCCLVSPSIFELNGQAEFMKHSGNIGSDSGLPRLTLLIKSGLVRLRFGQCHLKYLTGFLASLSSNEIKKKHSDDGKSDSHNNENQKQDSTSPIYVEESKDDLQTGLFEYVTQDGNSPHPTANKILFSEHDEERPPSMTWRYPMPRFLTKVIIMPLPFHVDEVMMEDELAEIPCVIRYWDQIEQDYVTYRHFFLSQSTTETLSFPDPCQDSSETCQVAAEEWQVVVDVAIESESEGKGQSDEIPEDILKHVTSVYKTPVSATSLAACLKVDSCYIPEKIPYLICTAAIGCVQVTLVNNFDTSENVQSRIFAPFFLDPFTYPFEQGACLLEVRDMTFKGSLNGGNSAAQSIYMEFDASLDVMNYNDLTWRNFVAVTNVVFDISLKLADPQSSGSNGLDLKKSKVSIDGSKLRTVASQSVVHTLSMTADNWSRTEQTEMDIPLLNHYIICNETEDILRFGQIDTDEDIQLASGQMYPYSWRSPHNRALHLCIDSIGDWKWSLPFDIDDVNGCSRTIKHSTHNSLLHIEVRRIGGIQKQIIISGGLVFRNCLKRDLEFELIIHHVEVIGQLQQQKITQVSKNFVVPCDTTRPSMSFSPGTVTSVYVRSVQHDRITMWSTPLPIANDDDGLDICMPLTLSSKEETINVWYNVSHINNSRYSQVQVCICPMFIIRNHLSWPVVMTAKQRDREETRQLLSPGCGQEIEMLGFEPHVWYNLIFQLEGTNECTDPPLALNTTFIDILKKKKKLDLQNIRFESEWPYIDGCSIQEEEPPRIMPQRSPKALARTSNADLQCQLLQRWPSLPAIIIEIRPKFVINNSSSEDLVLRDPETHLIWELKKNGTVTSPAIQGVIQFGKRLLDRSDVQWSNELRLLEHFEAKSRATFDNHQVEELSPHASTSFTIINREGNSCLQFALSSKIRNGIIIVNIRERFCVHNATGVTLKCFPTLCDGDYVQIKNAVCSDIILTTSPSNIHQVSLIQETDSSMTHLPDLSEFSIRFFFYASEESPETLHNGHAFDLSRDHLRENMLLRGIEDKPLLVAMTSYLQDSVINIFLDNDPCPSVVFTNQTAFDIIVTPASAEREADGKKRKTESDAIWEPSREVRSNESTGIQCQAFRDNFPKIGGVLEGFLKLQLCSDSKNKDYSEIVSLDSKNGISEITIGSQKLHLCCEKAANCFYVTVTNGIHGRSGVKASLDIPAVASHITSIDVIILDDELREEVCAITLNDLAIHHNLLPPEPCPDVGSESVLSIAIGALQIDNQSTDDYDHFPVVLLPLREVSQRYRGESPQNAPFSEMPASSCRSFFRTTIKAFKCNNNLAFIDNVAIHTQPLEVYAEDTFIYRIMSLLDSYSPPRQSYETSKKDATLIELTSAANRILHPINVGDVEIDDIRILLSIHASIKMFLATDHMPIVLGKFAICPARTTQKELTRWILYHYATQALVRAGLMLGSLEILANPTGFISSIGQGIVDFFTLPYDGLTRGPSAFVSGIRSGMGSFVRHTSVGALTSITNFASSLSRNMDRLSLDEQHQIRQQEQRCRTSSQVWPGFSNALSGFGVSLLGAVAGFSNALSGFGVSLLGAVAGIVDHPIKNIQNADDTREAVKGVLKGFGKGLVGIVTKPIGGAMELVSQTGQGILLGTGLTKPPAKLRPALTMEEITNFDKESFMKHSWKVIRLEFAEHDDLFITNAVHISSLSDKQGYNGAVILTSSALYLYDIQVNNIRMAISCNEVSMRLGKDGPHVVYVEKLGKQQTIGYGYSDLSNMSIDELERQVSHDSRRDSSTSQSSFSYPIFLQMSPKFAGLLLSQFAYQKCIAEEQIADEIENFEINIFK